MIRFHLHVLTLLRRLAAPAALLFALCAATTAALAQAVRWDPSGGTLARGETTRLELVFEDCAPKSTPRLPDIPGLTLGEPSTSQRSSFNLINGNATRSSTITLAYPAVATADIGAVITIPALTFETKEGRVTAQSVTYTVSDATMDDNRTKLAEVARSRFLLPAGTVWAGQVFPLAYTLEVEKGHFYQLGSHINWKPAPLLIEDWPQPDSTEVLQNGVRNLRINYRTLAMAPNAGDLPLQPANQLVNINTGTSQFGFFARPTLEQYVVTSDPATLTVKPLPTPAAAGFTGAVGDFTLTAKAVPLEAQVGEPVTWTLTLDGTGNWPEINALPSREVSKDFRVVQPQAKRTPAREGALFQASLSEDVVLIPTTPGIHVLGPVSLVVFDPARGEYRTLTTEKFTVKVTGAKPAAQTPPPASASSQSTPPPSAPAQPAEPKVEPVPTKPAAAIPLEPLASAAPVSAPLPAARVTLLAVLPFVLPPLLWIVLAVRRSRRTDPLRPLREARERLAGTINRLAASPDTETLRAWRRDAAVLWRVESVEPAPRDFADPVWARLWAESERVLYRAGTPIPADWIERARQALAARRVPVWSPVSLFKTRNLFPWLAAIALLLVTIPSLPAAETDAAGAYAAGDFAAAGKTWRERIQESPTDWTAHHNLSLALAQQKHWGEAAAQAGAAWLQQPRSDATHWQLVLAAGHDPKAAAPFTPYVIGQAAPLRRLAAYASPAEWQLALLASAVLAAVALSLCVLSGYTKIPAGLGLTLFVVALLGALAAITALKTYGPLAKKATVLVWAETTLYSVPTETAKDQQTTTLQPGTLAQVKKTFLGWRQLALPDGQTGWVRAENLTGLWTRP